MVLLWPPHATHPHSHLYTRTNTPTDAHQHYTKLQNAYEKNGNGNVDSRSFSNRAVRISAQRAQTVSQ